jgi:hypothetical protein
VLNEIYSDIAHLAAQCAVKYRDDQSQADFLKEAVERQARARGAVEQLLSNPASFMPTKFQGFHGRLTAALTAWEAAREHDVGSDPEPNSYRHKSTFQTHCGSRYGVLTPSARSLDPQWDPKAIL